MAILKSKLSNEIAVSMLDGSISVSPLEKVCGQHFLKFDAFRVEKTRVAFMFNGKDVFYMEHNADLSSDTLQIEGIDGRMAFNLSI